jgi:hypothetical protein
MTLALRNAQVLELVPGSWRVVGPQLADHSEVNRFVSCGFVMTSLLSRNDRDGGKRFSADAVRSWPRNLARDAE